MGAGNQVKLPVLNSQVIHGACGQMVTEGKPLFSPVQCHISTQVSSYVKDIGISGVFHNDVDRLRRKITRNRFPGFPIIFCDLDITIICSHIDQSLF